MHACRTPAAAGRSPQPGHSRRCAVMPSRVRAGRAARRRRRLHGRGMGMYAAAFHKHEVSMEVLPHLSLDDLTAIGVATVGARRKLALAIDEMWA